MKIKKHTQIEFAYIADYCMQYTDMYTVLKTFDTLWCSDFLKGKFDISSSTRYNSCDGKYTEYNEFMYLDKQSTSQLINMLIENKYIELFNKEPDYICITFSECYHPTSFLDKLKSKLKKLF